MIGKVVSQYMIVRKLGEDGTGNLYLAHDTELDRRVALKFLPQYLVSDDEALARFRRQAQAVAALDHPNIITVYEIGSHDGVPFIAMEYVKGRTLAEAIDKEKTTPREALDIAIQLCDGLSAAHRAGIFYREIRPDNILIGQGGRIHIADFGHTAGDQPSTISLETRTLAASERVRKGERQDYSSVRAIGALLEKLDAENQFEEIVSRATSETRDDRFLSVEVLAEDLVETRRRRFRGASRRSVARRVAWPIAVAILLTVAAAALVVWNPFERSVASRQESARRIVAVLPFENLGNAEDDYFADGITDEITSRLALMQGLGVISRTSARAYKGTQKSAREIGNELNADYILEGTIRWQKSRNQGRVRITPQLIRVADDTHVWSNTYEREITEVFSVQAEIAAQIAKALDVALLAHERRALTAQPTNNIAAYQAYLRGMKKLDAFDFSRESFELGLQMFERAVTLDPEFALAYARLSSMHSKMVHYGYDRSERRLEMARNAVDRALALQPDLAQAHLALGYYYYWGIRDYDRALDALNAAGARAPRNSEIWLATAYVKRRQGDLEAAAELLERDRELSPLDPSAAVGLGETYGTLRRYSTAEQSFKRSITLAPDKAYPYTELALLYLRWRGDAAAARATLEEMPSVGNTEECRVAFLVELLDRQYTAALERLDACPDRVLEASAFFMPIPLFAGMTLQLMGEPARAHSAFERSRAVLEEKLARDPRDHRVHSALGLTYAGLGRAQDAVRHGRRAVELYPMSRDALQAPVFVINLALIYTMVGDHEAALERLDSVLSIPSILSAPWLEKDPRWDPLREEPGFVALLREHRIDSGD